MSKMKQQVDEIIEHLRANPDAVDKAWKESERFQWTGPTMEDLMRSTEPKGTKRTELFDRFDNVMGNYAEGKAKDSDVVAIAIEVYKYLLAHPQSRLMSGYHQQSRTRTPMNQREIKFRALFEDMEMPGIRQWMYIGVNEYFDQPRWEQLTPWVQYTGRKDKNGNEIYEGDVIDHGDDMPVVVEWNRLQHKWTLYVYRDPVGNARCHLGEGMGDYEIIGNVFETPELVGK